MIFSEENALGDRLTKTHILSLQNTLIIHVSFIKIQDGMKTIVSRQFLLISTVLLILAQITAGQSSNVDYEKFQLGESRHIISSISLSPDGNTIAVSAVQSYPFVFYDWANRTVIDSFNVGNWYAGSKNSFSSNGKYVLLQQTKYIDWTPNKDRELKFEIFEASSGRSIKLYEEYHDVIITADEKYAVSLNKNNEIEFWNLEFNTKERSFIVPGATNGLAVSPDMKHIAVSCKTDPEQLKTNPAWVNNKKNRKNLEDFKQQLRVYDYHSLEKLFTVDEFYDVVYKLEYSPDGQFLFVYSIPHMKLQGPAGRKSYVEVVDGKMMEPLRKSFGSNAAYEADFQLSHNKKYFAIGSYGTKFQEVHVYDFETNVMLARFELSFRLFQNAKEWESQGDGRVSFFFLPGDQQMLVTFGNRVLLWNLEI